MRVQERLAVIAALVSVATAALILPGLVGKTVRLVDLIALFASGVGSGAAFVAAVHFKKNKAPPAASNSADQIGG